MKLVRERNDQDERRALAQTGNSRAPEPKEYSRVNYFCFAVFATIVDAALQTQDTLLAHYVGPDQAHDLVVAAISQVHLNQNRIHEHL